MTMGDTRASIFNVEDDDLSAFKPRKPAARQDEAATKQVAEKSGFVSREPKVVSMTAPVPAPVPDPIPVRLAQRRHRTGRNAQFNLKAKPETIAEFAAIADAQGWVFGEALEKAVELLRAKYGKKA